jgi:1-acyl-sn-glycerol-3-phosphate acyltransferase
LADDTSQDRTRAISREALAQAAAQAQAAEPRSALGGMAEALGYLRSLVVTIPLIYLATIFWGSLSLLVSLVDQTGRGQHACSRWWARTLLLVSRVRVRVRGAENFDPQRTHIFAANHQSYMDIPVLFGYLPANFRIMAKSSLFHLPFLGWHLQRSGHMPIARDNPRRAARSLLEAASHVRAGTSVFVFPEGGRSLDGRIAEFKAGTFLLAIKAGVPVVPITVNGTRNALMLNSWHIRPAAVEMIIHAPISTEGMHADSAEALSEQVKRVIAADYDEARALSAR